MYFMQRIIFLCGHSQVIIIYFSRLMTLRFQGKNVLVIGSTSEVAFLDSIGLCDAFSVTYHVPKLKAEDAGKVFIIFSISRFFF